MTKPSLNQPSFPTLLRRASFRRALHFSDVAPVLTAATSSITRILSLTLTMTLASCHVSKQATSVSTGELNTMATTEATASRLHLDSVAAAFAVMFDSLEIEMVFPVAPVNVAPANAAEYGIDVAPVLTAATSNTSPLTVATTLCPDGSPLSFGMGAFTSFGGEGNPSLTSGQPSYGIYPFDVAPVLTAATSNAVTIRISAAHAAATTAQSVSSLDVFATHTSDSLRSQSSTRTETAESSSATRMAKPINTTAIIIVLIALAAAAFLLRYLYVRRHFPK